MKIEETFERDGSLRDLYVLDTTIGDWQRLIDFLRESEYRIVYSVNGQVAKLPRLVEEVFEIHDEVVVLLSVDIDGIKFNCHFFCEEEIEFDFDVREVSDKARLAQLFDFMVNVGRAVGSNVLLTPENAPEAPLYAFNLSRGKVEAIVAGQSSQALVKIMKKEV